MLDITSSALIAASKGDNSGVDLIAKIDRAILDAIASTSGGLQAAVTAAAWGSVQNARAKGWTDKQVAVLTQLFAERGAHIVAVAIRTIEAERAAA